MLAPPRVLTHAETVTIRTDEIEWCVAPAPVDYATALATMTARAEAVVAGSEPELVWLLEHPSVYTAGTSADPAELLDPRFPVHVAGRGGRYTYHGPGQRIGYVVLDLGKRGRDVRCYVHALEQWVIDALATMGIVAFSAPDRVGIWTHDGGEEAKIGSIGVRVRKWVTMHGFALNIAPDLRHFEGIVPCGLPQFPVTSVQKLGGSQDFSTFDKALSLGFARFLRRVSPEVENEA
ncbi:MAG: lipoate-protein ligase B [Sphingomonas sp. 28-66-16]|nr:MAG: lipoate-protein ligase B [Sphingomonas sp. 28-66-16]